MAPDPAPVDPAEAEDPALYDHPPQSIEASYQVRIHARRTPLGVPNDYPVPTLAELAATIEGALAISAPAFTMSIKAERIDR